jgi:hypothetical protein
MSPFTQPVAGLALLFTALVAFGGNLRENEIIVGGGSCEADGFRVSGPSLYLRRNTPGVVAGMVQVPGEDPRYAYVLVIKGDPGRQFLAHYDGKSDVSGSVAGSRGFVEIANKRVAFEYKVEVDPTGKQAPREVLSINGKDLAIGKGRVVFVDLSADQVSWKQSQVQLPKAPPWPALVDQVESQAQDLLEHLRRAESGGPGLSEMNRRPSGQAVEPANGHAR